MCMCMCMYMYMYMYMYVYVCIYICTYVMIYVCIVTMYIYIYIYCEQNDPCSGCYPKSFQEHLVFAFSSVSMAATEERLVFLEIGHLSQTVRWRIVP